MSRPQTHFPILWVASAAGAQLPVSSAGLYRTPPPPPPRLRSWVTWRRVGWGRWFRGPHSHAWWLALVMRATPAGCVSVQHLAGTPRLLHWGPRARSSKRRQGRTSKHFFKKVSACAPLAKTCHTDKARFKGWRNTDPPLFLGREAENLGQVFPF